MENRIFIGLRKFYLGAKRISWTCKTATDTDFLGLIVVQSLADNTYFPGIGFHLFFPVPGGGIMTAMVLVESYKFYVVGRHDSFSDWNDFIYRQTAFITQSTNISRQRPAWNKIAIFSKPWYSWTEPESDLSNNIQFLCSTFDNIELLGTINGDPGPFFYRIEYVVFVFGNTVDRNVLRIKPGFESN